MATFVAQMTNVVNNGLADLGYERSYHRSVADKGALSADEIAGRIARIDELLSELRTAGRVVDAKDWCKQAGVSMGYIATFKTRLRRGDDVRGRTEEVSKLATFANVSSEYFLGQSDMRRSSSTISDRVHPTIARVAAAQGYDEEEVAAASSSVFGLRGTSEMTEEQAAEILDETRRQRRNLARVLRANGPGVLDPPPKTIPHATVDEDDPSGLKELSGGIAGGREAFAKKRPTKR